MAKKMKVQAKGTAKIIDDTKKTRTHRRGKTTLKKTVRKMKEQLALVSKVTLKDNLNYVDWNTTTWYNLSSTGLITTPFPNAVDMYNKPLVLTQVPSAATGALGAALDFVGYRQKDAIALSHLRLIYQLRPQPATSTTLTPIPTAVRVLGLVLQDNFAQEYVNQGNNMPESNFLANIAGIGTQVIAPFLRPRRHAYKVLFDKMHTINPSASNGLQTEEISISFNDKRVTYVAGGDTANVPTVLESNHILVYAFTDDSSTAGPPPATNVQLQLYARLTYRDAE